MKFDMSRAWNDATALLGSNRDVLLIVAGVFFFLPYLAMALLLPNYATSLETSAANPADVDQAFEQMVEVYGQIWWALLLVLIIQGIGMLAVLALLTDRSRPTVGEAIGIGAKGLPSYIGTQLLQSLLIVLIIAIPFFMAASGAVLIGAILSLVALVACIYLMVKFSLTSPVIGIDRLLNPIAVLQRSWRLTKGNSVRLFLFYLLLLIAATVLSIVIGLVVGLIAALAGDGGALIISGVLNALLNMIFVVVLLAVLAAVHRQLAGPSAAAVSETFE